MKSDFVANLTANLIPDPQDVSGDFFAVGGQIFATFSPWASWASVGNPYAPLAIPTLSTQASGSVGQVSPDSVVAVTSGGITINLLFDAAAMAAPASFRAGIQQAVSILSAAISDKITVNIKIDYSGTGGGAAAGPDHGLYQSYSSVRANLINGATPGDTSFNALSSGTSIQGQSNVAVWNAQLKLWGVMAANDTTTDDGGATFATDINPNLLVGVALHELTHALGRVPYGQQPDIFDLFRFTSAGTRLFLNGATAPAAYFSVDGGNTKLADYGQNSDPSDFLNSGVQGSTDPFNEFYNGSTSQQLTATDLKQLDVLGFHLVTPDRQAPILTADNPLSIRTGATHAIASSLLDASDTVSSAAQLHYTVTTGPAHGVLLLNGSATSSFTQADINNGLVSYHETASGVTSDSFSFTVADAAGNMTGTTSFQINVTSNHAPVGAADLDGDGKSDLIWRNDATGETVFWLMNGVAAKQSADGGTHNPAWYIAGTGDLDGDGKSDLIWRNDASGETVFWLMNGLTIKQSADGGTHNPAWHIAGTGDLDGDHKSDLIWRNDATGETVFWLMNGLTIKQSADGGTHNPAWHIAGTGDLDGDHKSDLIWRNDATGETVTWLMNGVSAKQSADEGTRNPAWHIAGVGDLDGDHNSDLIWRNDATGETVSWLMNGVSAKQSADEGTHNPAWHIANTGDLDGDGRSDLTWRNDVTGETALSLMNGFAVAASADLHTHNPDWLIV
jgi:hypothetical protein